MKKQLITLFIAAFALFVGCEDEKTKEEAKSGNLFILCEGNFGQVNASLWSVDLDDEEAAVNAKIYESLTGNSLGDVANAMYIHDDQLYIINNNTHTLQILQLGEELSHTASLTLHSASPRYMTFENGKGYITTWYSGILVLDLNQYRFVDTLNVDGMLEDIVYDDGSLFVSVPMNSDWTTNNDVLKIDISAGAVTDTFDVIAGPGRMLFEENELYIASTYYDLDWKTNTGMSKVDLSSGATTTNDFGASSSFGSDLVVIDGVVYRSSDGGITAINADLSADANNSIDQFSGIFAVGVSGDHIFFGVTDYVAPDTVYVTDLTGNIEHMFTVGVLPTDFAVYEK